MKSIKNVLGAIVLIAFTTLCFAFFLQNGDHVRVNLFALRSPELPLWIFVLGAFFLGALLTSLFTLVTIIRYKSKLRKQRKSFDVIEKELHQLRNQPIDEVPQDDQVEVAELVDS